MSGPAVEVGDRSYQAGDRVVATRNNRRFAGLRNSHTATVVAVDPRARSVSIRRDHDRAEITLDETYAAAHLEHAYATTVHKAQGATYQAPSRVYADLQGATLAEHGYVALSRSARDSHLYLAADQMAAHIAPRVFIDDRREPLARLAEQLHASAVEPLAIDSGRPVASERTVDLVARRDELAAVLRTIPPDVSDRITQADQTLAATRDAAARPGASRGAMERAETLETQHAQLLDQADQRRRWLERHGRLVAEYQDVAGELAARAERRLASLPFDPDAVEVLGPPPDRDAPAAQVEAWRVAAREDVAVEQRHGIVDLSDRHATRQLHDRLQELQQVRHPQQSLGLILRR